MGKNQAGKRPVTKICCWVLSYMHIGYTHLELHCSFFSTEQYWIKLYIPYIHPLYLRNYCSSLVFLEGGNSIYTYGCCWWMFPLLVHIHWASDARDQWSHARLLNFIVINYMVYICLQYISPHCDSFWQKLSQYGVKILYTYVYHIYLDVVPA